MDLIESSTDLRNRIENA